MCIFMYMRCTYSNVTHTHMYVHEHNDCVIIQSMVKPSICSPFVQHLKLDTHMYTYMTMFFFI